MARVVLASSSKARAELLARLEIPFESVDPGVDERAEDGAFSTLGPTGFALHLAGLKVAAVAAKRPGAWILGADQLAILDGHKLDKPGTVEAAVEQLMRLAGRTHELVTGVALRHPEGPIREALDVQRMTMRPFTARQAAEYVARHRPLDCAGAYRIEDAGIKLFERLHGEDYTGIIGLPLLSCARLLRDAGLLA